MSLISAGRILPRILTWKKITSRQRVSILLAAMPKSASTFLSRSIQKVTGFEDYYLAQSYKNIEQELHLPALIDSYNINTVTQQHFRANEPNISLLQSFDIRPVIIYRDIADVIVSMRDHFLKESLDNLPGLFPPQDFAARNSTEQIDYLIRYAAPWLVSFYVSWERVRADNRLQTLCLRYEDCRRDWVEAIFTILEFYKLSIARSDIKDAVDSFNRVRDKNVRKNVGIAGRGKTSINQDHLARLIELSNCYPDIDFSPVIAGDTEIGK